jgi:hypothetical protein
MRTASIYAAKKKRRTPKNMKIRSWFNQNRFTSIVRFSCAGALISAGVVSAILALPLSTTGSNPPPAEPQAIDDSQMQALSTTIRGAAPATHGAHGCPLVWHDLESGQWGYLWLQHGWRRPEQLLGLRLRRDHSDRHHSHQGRRQRHNV